MSDESNKTTFTPPRAATLLKSTLAALVVAAVLLVAAVLPAEYGIDPTGAGKVLGLTQLHAAEQTETAAETDAASETETAAEAETTAPAPWEDQEAGGKQTPVPLTQYAHTHDGPPKTETIMVHLAPGEEVEHKAMLAAGEPLFWSWSIPEGDVYFDFHGEPTEGDYERGYFLSYGEGESGGEQGSFVAPFTGHHGWFWLNYNEEPVTVELTIQGYYESHEELYRAGN